MAFLNNTLVVPQHLSRGFNSERQQRQQSGLSVRRVGVRIVSKLLWRQADKQFERIVWLDQFQKLLDKQRPGVVLTRVGSWSIEHQNRRGGPRLKLIEQLLGKVRSLPLRGERGQTRDQPIPP